MASNAFDTAAVAVAQQCKRRHWDSVVTNGNTFGWVSADAIHDWISTEVGLRSPQSIIAELASRLTDADALALLHAIGHDKDAVHNPLDTALESLVQARLIDAAEAIINDNDGPATSFASLERKTGGGVFGAMGLRP